MRSIAAVARDVLDQRGIELTWDDVLAIEAGLRNSEVWERDVTNEATRYHHTSCKFLQQAFSHENIAAVVERTGLSLQTVNEVARELRRG
ncbi:helix-turn-helix DNA binding domain protein [Arthrobacter phage Pureglobe5]|nr:helix-turn-helix DNA binding domain protein [Arthrobacter phage Pureglobe5]